MIFTLIAYQPNVTDRRFDEYRDSDLIIESFTDREKLIARWVELSSDVGLKFELDNTYEECTLLIDGYTGSEEGAPHYEMRSEIYDEAQRRIGEAKDATLRIKQEAVDRRLRAEEAKQKSPEYREYQRLHGKFGR